MVDTNRASFPSLLSDLAAEHAHVTEQNRVLAAEHAHVTEQNRVLQARIESMMQGNNFAPRGRNELADHTAEADEAKPLSMVVRSKSSSLCYATNGNDGDTQGPIGFSSEGSKVWADHLRTSQDEQSKANEVDDRFSLFNPFQSLSSLRQGSKTSLSSSDQRLEEISRRRAVLRTVGVTWNEGENFAINPEHSRFLERWDSITMFSLIFVAIICPVQISMLKSKFDTLFVLNCFIDFVFFLDMVLQFFVMYPKRTSWGTALEHRPKAIACNYLKSWFAIDFLSVVPFDLISILRDQKEMNRMKAVKVIRLLRLIKLMRILRASRLFRRFESRMPISYKQWALLRFFIMLMVIIHWMANLWALTLVLVEETEGVPRWVDSFLELEENVESKTKDTPWKLYVASVYFTSYTLTSVGYGDIGPKNIVERVMCVFMLVMSGTSWAVVLGQVCGIVANMNPDEQAFRKTMDDLNHMMTERAFPQEMCQRLRNFFHSDKLAQRRLTHQQSLFAMSQGLRGEVAIQINRPWINKVSMLRNLLKQAETASCGRFIHAFVVDVSMALQPEVHAQSEVFGRVRQLYILIRGLVNRPPRLHLHGAVWGGDFVLLDKDLIEPSESFALTYVELTTLSREAFFMTVSKYKAQCPQLLKSVRRFCCWMAVQRALLKEAKHRQRLAQERFAQQMTEEMSSPSPVEEPEAQIGPASTTTAEISC